MSKLKCNECGQIFDSNQSTCPNCGCPASECETVSDKNREPVIEQQEPHTEKQQQPEKELKQKIRSHSTIECMTECSDCGVSISANAKRCPHCGAKGKFAPLDYGDAIYDCFCRKYFYFKGRSRRSEVFPFLILVGMMCGTLIYFKQDGAPSGGPSPEWLPFFITLLPTLGAIVRRLHDIGRSGWWVLLPIVGEIFIFKDSDKKENEYGKSPKYQSEYFTEELPDKGTHIGKIIAIIFAAIFALQILILLGYSIGSQMY